VPLLWLMLQNVSEQAMPTKSMNGESTIAKDGYDDDRGRLEQVRSFYDNVGWQRGETGAFDKTLWEDSRAVSSRYQSRCRTRLLDLVARSKSGVLVDAGCGSVQHPEYLDIYREFERVVLADISHVGLRAAADVGNAVKVVCSAHELPLGSNSADAYLAVNMINHVPPSMQAKVVHEALRVIKPTGLATFVSFNPDRTRLLPSVNICQTGTKQKGSPSSSSKRTALYWSAPSIGWWAQFSQVADIRVAPHRLLFVTDAQRLVPDSVLGELILRAISGFEIAFPRAAARHGAYYKVTLKPKGGLNG